MGWLLTFTIGPVQEFISAARRTRDLWCGSHILADLSGEAARVIRKNHGELIFPGLENATDEIPGGIANIITAEFKGPYSPRTAAAAAATAVQTRWREGYAEIALEKLGGEKGGLLDEARFRAQIGDVIECYSAWVKYDGPGSYKEQRKKLEEMVEARKQTRTFEQVVSMDMQIPKSSLDGKRESVLRQESGKDGHARQPRGQGLTRYMRMTPGEQLDAIGVTRRLAMPEFFPSASRIAADPWVRGMARRRMRELDEIVKACEGMGSVAEWPQFRAFPHDGQLLYVDRHAALAEEMGIAAEDLSRVRKLLGAVRKAPQTYLTILSGDADGMGVALGAIKFPGTHRLFSAKMAKFAEAVKEIVEKHSGAAIYAGGDDVLAMLPLDTSVACADELRSAYAAVVKSAFEALPENDRPKAYPTLSIGIGIGHFLDPLEDLLAQARGAEHEAKTGEKNAVCVSMQPRNGSPIMVRTGWDDKPAEEMAKYVRWHREDRLPDGAAYGLNRLAAFYENWPEDKSEPKDASAVLAMRQDAVRLLKRKRSTAKAEQTAQIAELEEAIGKLTGVKDLERMSAKLLIARRIAEAAEQGDGV